MHLSRRNLYLHFELIFKYILTRLSYPPSITPCFSCYRYINLCLKRILWTCGNILWCEIDFLQKIYILAIIAYYFHIVSGIICKVNTVINLQFYINLTIIFTKNFAIYYGSKKLKYFNQKIKIFAGKSDYYLEIIDCFSFHSTNDPLSCNKIKWLAPFSCDHFILLNL